VCVGYAPVLSWDHHLLFPLSGFVFSSGATKDSRVFSSARNFNVSLLSPREEEEEAERPVCLVLLLHGWTDGRVGKGRKEENTSKMDDGQGGYTATTTWTAFRGF
jgi:hypothetical protein